MLLVLPCICTTCVCTCIVVGIASKTVFVLTLQFFTDVHVHIVWQLSSVCVWVCVCVCACVRACVCGCVGVSKKSGSSCCCSLFRHSRQSGPSLFPGKSCFLSIGRLIAFLWRSKSWQILVEESSTCIFLVLNEAAFL